jgi:raffinose/stachyose/melibiose transport system permease protein
MLTRNILSSPDTAWIGLVIVSVWQAAAFNTILYLAGLQSIPEELNEAYDLDGGGGLKRFLYITFPMIAPFFTINMVLGMKNFLLAFDIIISLTGGGPGRATESVSLLIYRGGFQGGEFAYQSANAIVLGVLIATVSILQTKVLKKREVQI